MSRSNLDLVHSLFKSLAKYSFDKKQLDPQMFCPLTERLFYEVFNDAMKSDNKVCVFSSVEIGRRLGGQDRHVIYRRMKLLAKYALITVNIETKINDKGIVKRQKIKVNPKIDYIFGARSKQSIIMKCIGSFFAVARERDELEGNFQGFQFNLRYGDLEPKDIKDIICETKETSVEEYEQTPSQAGNELNNILEKEDRDKARKAKESKYWREKSAMYVERAAYLWKQAQMKHGFGAALPNWQGDTKNMPNQAKSERNELISTFKQYGGKTAALSWYIYCAGRPEMDPKTGRTAFDSTAPHRQYITADRKPSQYTKHFNSIIADPLFKEHATTKWPEISKTLHNFFGDLLDILPRDSMTETSKTGIPFGDTGPSLDEVVQ